MSGKLIDLSGNMIYQVAIQGISFLIFFVLLKKFFWDKVVAILDKRKAEIDQDYSLAEKAKNEALTLQENYDEKLNHFNEEVARLTKEAQQDGAKIKEQIVEDARDKAQKMVADAEKQAQSAKAQAMRDVQQEMIDISFDVAGKILDSEIDQDAQKELVTKAIARLDEV